MPPLPTGPASLGSRGGPVLFIFLAFRHRHLIAAVVIGVLRVALDPVGADGVGVTQIQQALPQIRVQGGFLQPRARQPLAQPFSRASMTYLESDHSSTWQGSFKSSRAEITAVSSMRLLVVLAWPPEISRL